MGQVVGNISDIIGCMDPYATNYDPLATMPCPSCCLYVTEIIGCTDPFATNFNPDANISCANCCIYTTGPIRPIGFDTIGFGNIPDIVIVTEIPTEKCLGPYQITIDNTVLGVESAECCSDTNTNLGPAPLGQQYYWDGRTCRIVTKCPTSTTCIDCKNFN